MLIINFIVEIVIVYGLRREIDGGNYENLWYVFYFGEIILDDW